MKKDFRIYLVQKDHQVQVSGTAAEYASNFLIIKDGQEIVASFLISQIQGWKIDE